MINNKVVTWIGVLVGTAGFGLSLATTAHLVGAGAMAIAVGLTALGKSLAGGAS